MITVSNAFLYALLYIGQTSASSVLTLEGEVLCYIFDIVRNYSNLRR